MFPDFASASRRARARSARSRFKAARRDASRTRLGLQSPRPRLAGCDRGSEACAEEVARGAPFSGSEVGDTAEISFGARSGGLTSFLRFPETIRIRFQRAITISTFLRARMFSASSRSPLRPGWQLRPFYGTGLR